MSQNLITPLQDQGELGHIPLTRSEEGQFRSLARWLAICGWINFGLGVIELLNLFASRNLSPIFSALIKVILGTLCLQAARAFRRVADTDGADQSYLIRAFGKLHPLFLLQAVLVILGLVLVTALLLFVLLMGVAHR